MKRSLLLVFMAMALLSAPAVAEASDTQVVVSGDVNVPRGESVDDVIVASGDANIAGSVKNDVVVLAGRVRVSGTVGGDVVALSDPILLSRTARVGGDLIYGDEHPVVAPGAQVDGEVKNWDESEVADEIGRAALVFGALVLLGLALSTLAIGLVLLWLFPRAADALLSPARDRVGASIGWGLLLSIGLPILAVLLLITVVGIPLGGFLLLALLPLYAVGHVTSQWLLGRKIAAGSRRWVSFLVGWAILNVAALIPFLGALVGTAATVFGLGVLAIAAWQARGAGQPPAPAPVAPAGPAGGTPVPPPPSV